MDATLEKSKGITALVCGGKRVHRDVYIHISLLAEQAAAIQNMIEEARCLACLDEGDFNVIRFSQQQQIGLLHYKKFFEDPFPKLTNSFLVDLIGKQVRRTCFAARNNPPILHRKELLLSDKHPSREQFSALTDALEKRGLFKKSQGIGYQRQWESRLVSHGIVISGHAVVEADTTQKISQDEKGIERHRTAIARDRLSAPMQALARHGILISERTILDYGCGQGDDVRALQAGGFTVSGWDPHYARDVPLKPADVVNVGFVLNVIEEPHERIQAVRRAFDLTKQCLAVSVMVVGKGETASRKAYRDGILTSWGTFQKYYRQDELKEFLDAALRTEAIAVAPGIFFVFKDKILEQRFLLDRQRRIQVPLSPDLKPPLDRPTVAQRRLEALRPLLERLWQQMLLVGRPLVEEELGFELLAEIQKQLGSLRRAERLVTSQFDPQDLISAGNARREDLLVYFGLNLFNGRTKYSALPPELQRDIKVFFSNATSAFEAARALLFSVGKSDVVDEACGRAASAGLGYLSEGHSLQLHSSQINRLPAPLRCYVGCGAKLYGDVDTADLIKIHIRSGKLTLLFYEEFETSPLPRLRERVKINMRSQRIDFFQHTADREEQLLFLKSRYMSPDQADYTRQKQFDDAIVDLGLFDFAEYGPQADVFRSTLSRAGYAVSGFALEKSSSTIAAAAKL